MHHRVDRVGRAQAAVLLIEDAWPSPGALIDAAASRSDFSARSLYYPGLRSNAPRDYTKGLFEALRDLIRSTFELRDELVITDSSFSLVTTPADRLVPFQRVPHFDSVDQDRIAVLHYLSGQGGTSFYRHRSTGLEVITAEVQENYIRTVNAEVRAAGVPPAAYVDGDTELFERIARYDAVFNRVLIYRGSMLHSVNVPADFVPDANPRTGRLTVNTFLNTRASEEASQRRASAGR